MSSITQYLEQRYLPIGTFDLVLLILFAGLLYRRVGLKWFAGITAALTPMATFWTTSVLLLATELLFVYFFGWLLLLVLGGAGGSAVSSTTTSRSRIPSGAPARFRPEIQQPGAHKDGYEPWADPDNWD